MEHTTNQHHNTDKLLRLKQIIGPNGILPFSRSTFYNRINAGEIDPPIKLGDRVSAWPESCILDYIQRMEGQGNA